MSAGIATQLTPDELLALIKDGESYADIARSLTPERHRNTVREYAVRVIGREKLSQLKPVYGALKKAVYVILDEDPDRHRPTIAAEVGCTVNMVCAYVRTWKSDRDKALGGTRCKHCKLKTWPENPITHNGWCLLCCFAELRVSPLTFHLGGGAAVLRDPAQRSELVTEVSGLMETVT